MINFRHVVFLFAIMILPLVILSQAIPDDEKPPAGYQPDYRIDNMGYWMKMARLGLVRYNPDVVAPAATFRGSAINATTVVTTDSPDVPVTEENSTQSENSIFVFPDDISSALNSNNSTQNPVGSLYGADYLLTHDEGENWEGSIQGAGGSNSGDPAAVIGTNGMQFIGFINNGSGQTVARSDDGGQTWTDHVVANKPSGFGSVLDKNHLWIDNAPDSPYEGYLYDAWTNFGGGNDGDIELSRSIDNGVTWSSPINVSSAAGGSQCQGVNIHSGPDGEVYTAFAIYDGGGDEKAIGFAKSTNGGLSFQPAVRAINNIKGIRSSETSKNMRVNSFPSMTVDISGGSNNGNIYIVWPNIGVPGTNIGPDIDVYMIRSVNGGTSWSTPIRINQDPTGLGKEHYFPWITCDPETGTLSVIFYDDRNVGSTQCEVWVANSTNGGTTWEDFKVSDVSFTPQPIPGLASNYFGDYLGINARAGIVYPCWTDNRSGVAMSYVSPFVTPAGPRPASNPEPANASNNNFPWASLHWKDFRDRSSSFKVYLGTNNPPTNIVNGVTLTDTFYIPQDELQFDQQYFWRIESFNSYGQASSDTWTFSIGPQPDEDFETGDFSKNDWQFAGDADWLIDNSVHRNGTYSAKSGIISDNQSTSLKIELELISSPFAAKISFWKKTSTQSGADVLQFLVNDVIMGEWSGETDWSFEQYLVIDGGFHTFEWKYIKNNSIAEGQDAVWVDYIEFPPIEQLTANAGPNGTVCEGSTYQCAGTSTNYTSLEWTTSGDGTFDDITLLSAEYTPGSGDISNGTVTLTLTASDGTNTISDDLILTIQPAPSVILDNSATVCYFDTYTVQNAIAENYSQLLWSTSGDGTFDDNSILSPVYTPGENDITFGIVTLTLTATGLIPCNDASGSTILNILHIPAQTEIPTGPAELCENNENTVYTTTSVEDATSYQWILSGSSSAGTVTGTDTIATVDWNSDFSGFAELQVHAQNDCGVGLPSQSLVIWVAPLPEQSGTPVGPDTVCSFPQPSISDFITSGSVNADFYEWELSPSEAGTISGTGTVGTVTWNLWNGNAYIEVQGINACGEGTYSDEHLVVVDVCEGIGDLKDISNISIFPNPNNGIFNINMNAGHSTGVILKVYTPLGKVIYQKNETLISGRTLTEIDLSDQANGVYFLSVSDGTNQIMKEIVIRK
jgi:hypothetical protein